VIKLRAKGRLVVKIERLEYSRLKFFARPAYQRTALIVALSFLSACGSDEQTVKPVTETDSAFAAGRVIYEKNCKVCHAQGLNGAPILGNQAMWKPRLARSESVLIQHATNGFGLMPANSGRTGLDDADIPLAVRYMLSELKE